jgi:hypothetical protein
MLSVHLIERRFSARRFDALLEAVVANGLMLPVPLRIRLSEHEVCAVALALRRATELAYGPSSTGAAMARFILERQQDDGSWHGDPLATAVALAALAAVRRQAFVPAEVRKLNLAIERAAAALTAMQEADGLFFAADDRTEQDRALTGAYILSLLAADADFRRTVRLADLLDYFEANADRLEPDTFALYHLSQMDAPVPPPMSVAAAA